MEIEGRNGRYDRYRFLLGSFVIMESKLKEPLLISGGKGIIPGGQIIFSQSGRHRKLIITIRRRR